MLMFAVLSLYLLLSGCSDGLGNSGDKKVSYPIIDSGHIVQYASPHSSIHWIDNSRVLFIGYDPDNPEPDDYKPGTNSAKRHLLIWNVKTNGVTQYRRVDSYSGVSFQEGISTYRVVVDGERVRYRGLLGAETLYKPVNNQLVIGGNGF
ncbi:MAG: hypothetical protein JKY89_11545, partial [Immundisolibacteraceae bacterium]|nr:hypothetical protein [Immundisolibacteraceae bacterium]